MIEFDDNKPIYRQIVDYAFNCIIEGVWTPGVRIPSVREMAASLGVNTRTVLKALEDLQDLNVIEPRRGMGFILRGDAAETILTLRRKEFFDVTLPALVTEMERLGISAEDLISNIKNNTFYGK